MLIDLLDDIGPSLMLGLLISAAISVLVPPNSVSPGSLGSWAMMGVILAIAIPLYVCASGSTPIAAVLLAKGFSPGSVLVFLLAGPATNAAAVIVIARELGKRAAAIYVCGIAFIALLFGVAVDRLFPNIDLSAAMMTASHAEAHSAVATISAVVLLLLLVRPLTRAVRRRLARFTGPRGDTDLLLEGRSGCH